MPSSRRRSPIGLSTVNVSSLFIHLPRPHARQFDVLDISVCRLYIAPARRGAASRATANGLRKISAERHVWSAAETDWRDQSASPRSSPSGASLCLSLSPFSPDFIPRLFVVPSSPRASTSSFLPVILHLNAPSRYTELSLASPGLYLRKEEPISNYTRSLMTRYDVVIPERRE